ncbi:MAG TPA: hypothetical protein VMJ65_04290 [Solirubrobacteraceae bacterium]|nr:hypothetical protein [Solirubrobacteraceae bacterium]
MHGTLGSVRGALTSLVVPAALLGQPLASQVGGDADDADPRLVWQSSIGQFIFLQALAEERM